ncbi:unnamed protein product [Heligmosomoides polygyrus]|uniref:Uncharacterized protein n=1 Tax=Heligmosomoides polygyrus TaxID=6339 RepID=A0A183FKZ2_HELPZ|nr:unnamed protein product [Heligmosomoides polygyrus]
MHSTRDGDSDGGDENDEGAARSGGTVFEGQPVWSSGEIAKSTQLQRDRPGRSRRAGRFPQGRPVNAPRGPPLTPPERHRFVVREM